MLVEGVDDTVDFWSILGGDRSGSLGVSELNQKLDGIL